jgi:cold shock protein
MAIGTVQQYSSIRGCGFIQPDDSSSVVPVYISAVHNAGLFALRDGQKVAYELVESRSGKVSAGNLKVLS